MSAKRSADIPVREKEHGLSSPFRRGLPHRRGTTSDSETDKDLKAIQERGRL